MLITHGSSLMSKPRAATSVHTMKRTSPSLNAARLRRLTNSSGGHTVEDTQCDRRMVGGGDLRMEGGARGATSSPLVSHRSSIERIPASTTHEYGFSTPFSALPR
jgi:hypothetical protein